jgi:hypothetical protein
MIYVFEDVKSSGVLSVNSWMLFSHAALLEHLRVCVFLVSVILRCAALTVSRCVIGEFSEAACPSLCYINIFGMYFFESF